MKLYLDSTDSLRTVIKIEDKEYINVVSSPRDQNVFGFLQSCLEKSSINPQEITEIEVNRGPGSFTGTRIGVTIANALGFALKVPVNGSLDPVEPIYSSPPAITTPR